MKKFLLSIVVALMMSGSAFAQIWGPAAPMRYSSSWSHNTAVTGNVGVTIFSAASNTKGAVAFVGTFITGSAAENQSCGFIAHTASPTAITQGDLLTVPLFMYVDGAVNYSAGRLAEPIFIAPGKGLYFLCSVDGLGTSPNLRNALYTLLQ